MGSVSPSLQIRGCPIASGMKPVIAGILNMTPDSFSDGGRFDDHEQAIAAAMEMVEQGAGIIDVGGESTRPGSEEVPASQQLARVLPIIGELSTRLPDHGVLISVDTRSAAVAEAALVHGAAIVNDISALRHDPAMAAVVARYRAGVILMHMKGTPATMQQDPTYDDVVREVKDFLRERLAFAESAGIVHERIIVDPGIGIGFAKNTAHNLEILRHVAEFRELGVPVMVGPSRKRFIGEVLNIPHPRERAGGTAAVVAACALAGIEIIRVHDVALCRQVADLCTAIRG